VVVLMAMLVRVRCRCRHRSSHARVFFKRTVKIYEEIENQKGTTVQREIL
jgi:hypothetical protein